MLIRAIVLILSVLILFSDLFNTLNIDSMKKYIILLLATTFLLGTSVSSCTNFLEEKPESEFDEGTFYKTVESLKVGAVGAFLRCAICITSATNTPLFVGMVGTDECMYPNETNLRGFIDATHIRLPMAVSSNSGFATTG